MFRFSITLTCLFPIIVCGVVRVCVRVHVHVCVCVHASDATLKYVSLLIVFSFHFIRVERTWRCLSVGLQGHPIEQARSKRGHSTAAMGRQRANVSNA